MSIDDLAPELLHQILSCLHPSLTNTALVCRKWVAPSREILWGRTTLTVDEYIPKGYSSVLDPKCTIPHHIWRIKVDEPKVSSADWRRELLAILRHFTSATKLMIVHLDLTNYDRSEQEQLLKSFLSCEILEIHSLKAENLSDVAPSILGSSKLRRLALGGLTLSTLDDRVGMTLSSAQPLLPRLSHLLIFKESTGTWYGLLPALAEQPVLENLKCAVIICHDDQVVSKLLRKTAPSLISLALQLKHPGAVPDLGNFKSLRNLSIDLPKDDISNIFLLSEFVQIMSSVAAIERLYINCGTHMLVLDRQITHAQPLYTALDRQLARIASLQKVVFTLDLSGFMSGSGVTGNRRWFHPRVVENWVSNLLDFGQAKLPSCHERGIIIEAARMVGSWTGNACHNLELPE